MILTGKNKIANILEYILGVAAFLSLFVFVYVRMNLEISDPDIWCHLKTGEYIVQQGSVPGVDMFSSTAAGRPWIDHSWLLQVILYLVYHFAGPNHLILLCALTLTAAFLLLFLCLYRNPRHLSFIICVLFLAIYASQIRFNLRPENFSVLFLCAYLFILIRLIRTRWVLLLPLLQLVWVNFHGFFIFGLVLPGIFLLGQWLKEKGFLFRPWNKVDLLDQESSQRLKQVFLITCLASFVSPYGYKAIFYPLWVAATSAGSSGIFYRYITELLPTWHIFTLGYQLEFYFILIIVSFLAFILTLRRLNFTYLVLWLVFLILSLGVNRNIIYFNFIAFIVIVDTFVNKLEIQRAHFITRFYRGLAYIRHLVMIGIIIMTVQKVQGVIERSYYVFEENRFKSILLGVTADGYPDKAVDFIRKNKLPANIFNVFNSGSYIAYRLWPQYKVFIDGRTELYGSHFFESYLRVLNGDEPSIKSMFERYGVNTLLLDGEAMDIHGPSSYFLESPEWALVYFDGDAVFVRNNEQNRAIVDQFRIGFSKWKVEKADVEKIGWSKVPVDNFIKRGWVLYHWGLYEHAFQAANQALRILPSSSSAYTIIGRIYTKWGSLKEAFEYLRLAHIYAPGQKSTLTSVGEYYAQAGKLKDAREMYKRLVKKYPYYPEGHFLLAASYSREKENSLALAAFRKAIRLNPYRAKYYEALGDLLSKNNDKEGAQGIYNDAINQGLDWKFFCGKIADLHRKSPAK